MHATIRRYEGVDAARTNELVGGVNETLIPQLRELPGFSGYYLIEAGNGVLSSLSLFETSEQAMRPRNSWRSGSPTRTSVRRFPTPRRSRAARSLRTAVAWSPSSSSSSEVRKPIVVAARLCSDPRVEAARRLGERVVVTPATSRWAPLVVCARPQRAPRPGRGRAGSC